MTTNTTSAPGGLIPEGLIPEALMPGFRGDLAWIHAWEGHRGRPYYPGGAWSGVTLDPGADLGHIDWALFRAAYGRVLTRDELAACARARGLRGAAAGSRLENDAELRAIDITRAQATSLMPVVAAPYWQQIARRFPVICAPGAPSVVQTALLSLAYNRGPHNSALGTLTSPLSEGARSGDWRPLAAAIDQMQNDHPLRGITRRRDAEAALVGLQADALINERMNERRQAAARREAAVLEAIEHLAIIPPEDLPTTPIEDLLPPCLHTR